MFKYEYIWCFHSKCIANTEPTPFIKKNIKIRVWVNVYFLTLIPAGSPNPAGSTVSVTYPGIFLPDTFFHVV